ncbi:pre-60S factor REI1 [Nematocida homosporus]|uniref:pre-60S factor REI1 n=1 Tax=Nematocida homosporus TaxID=1912981 RepID=UPI00221F50AC|nr:pre-60S factor REI1 [Nematocida homosporus]KAI5184404.1 pre-60S factor REI1 [Nematocida homosporus]
MTEMEWNTLETEKSNGSGVGSNGRSSRSDVAKSEHQENGYSLGVGECLFCGTVVKTETEPFYMDVEYLKHLHTHGFKLLMTQCISDLYGLMTCLVKRIESCRCLFCSKRFSSIGSARSHMVSLFHTRYVNSDEYDEYYTYPEPKPAYVSADGAELLLPSGKIVGNKKYMKYYAQTLREEGYYKNLDPIRVKFEEKRIQERQVFEKTQEELVQVEKHKRREQRNDLKVSKAANKQTYYREDWLQ